VVLGDPIASFPGVIGTFMGRDALSIASRCLNNGPSSQVLLPAFVCKEVVKPFIGKAGVSFYDVGPELSVDPDKLKSRLSDTQARAVVMVNYFGFLQPYRDEIKRICAESQVHLVEDAAHSLLTAGSGESGNISIYSFRKLLPVPDGGGLKINGGDTMPQTAFYPRFFSDMLSLLIRLKALCQVRSATVSRSAFESAGPRNGARTNGSAGRRILPLSSCSRRRLISIDYSEIISRRRADYCFWSEFLDGNSHFRPLFPELGRGVCPMAFPARMKERGRFKSRMAERGVHLKSYWHLSDRVGREHVESHSLASEVITLPVYPELGEWEKAELTREISSW
jgi:dTDP-4-amino-4,6-dideoxygalactose transaminase